MTKVIAKRKAAENKLRGKDVLVYINFGEGATEASPKWALLGGQTKGSLSMSADDIDATNKTSRGWGEKYQGIKSTELSIEGIVLNSDEAYAALKDAFIKGDPVDICRFATDGSGERNWYSITELSDEAPHDDMVTYSVTLGGIGEPTFFTGLKTVDEVGKNSSISH